ncbi:MAG TPA: radical SAM protein [Myxococcota bacterium]|nr:radical SAM protein [Myxococcota bacterium]
MRIAFVSGNQEKLPDAVVPLGMLYVMASTPGHHARTLIDLCFEREPARVLGERLRAFAPDLVALGMRNIQGADYSGVSNSLAYYGHLVDAVREATRAPIVMGGPGFSVMPRELMARLRPEFGISGEAEGAFPELCRALESGAGGFDLIGGLHWYDGDALRTNAARSFVEMDGIARPDRSLADPRYYERYGIESVQTKRGCPLRCDYCTYPIIEGRVGRARSPAAVVDEMFAALEQHPGIRHFFIVDSVFNLPKAHAKAVCRELTSRGWSVPWTCYANPLGFDLEMAQLARAAGCAGMEVGSDSGCDEVLLRLKKGFTTAQVRALHDHCAAAGVPDCHTFILGTTGETLDDVRRTLDFAVALDPWSAVFMLWVDDREALDADLRAERDVMRARIAEILRGYASTRPTWAVPPLRINFDERLFSRLRRRGFHGPLWQHMRAPFVGDAASGVPAPA